MQFYLKQIERGMIENTRETEKVPMKANAFTPYTSRRL
ncbi:hypothetical protein LLB_3780 [Legionella longbeachae D-4968]|nr:hypothetical protein LLB_3780 [Legionella longbeachae D-4968]